MEGIVDFIVALDIPLVDEGTARFISHLIFAGIIAVAAPGSLVILTWLERKIIARIQRRIGPNRAGPFGLFQGLADMVKMFTKEDITPAKADRLVYNMAPGLAVISSIMAMAVIPFTPGFIGADFNVAVLYIIAIGGIGTLAILMGGWASNNKYALLGAFRVVAMLLTYEIPMIVTLLMVTMVTGSMSFADIVAAQTANPLQWYIVLLPAAGLIFFVAGVAETGRSPFDLVEAESEIIAGFHTEYSGIKFGMFMIGEYVHMFALAFFTAVLFFGGWHFPFIDITVWLPGPVAAVVGLIVLLVKTFMFVFIMMWFRGTLPRFRIDHLLDFCWKFLVPTSLTLAIAVAVVVWIFARVEGVVGAGGEFVALIGVNVIVTGVALLFVSRAARRSRSKGLRSVAAVEGAPAGK